MGRHHAPAPRGHDPGGFMFPGSSLYYMDRPNFAHGFARANDVAAPRPAERAPRPEVTAPPAAAVVALDRRRASTRRSYQPVKVRHG